MKMQKPKGFKYPNLYGVDIPENKELVDVPDNKVGLFARRGFTKMEDNKEYKCKHCGKKLNSKKALTKHYRECGTE